MASYKTPRVVSVGGTGGVQKILLGGNNPVTVQSMWKESISSLQDDFSRLDALLSRLEELRALGLDIMRFAVPDHESANALCAIASHTSMPVVADIHFDYRLALDCLKGSVSAIRINPGNIGSLDKVEAVVRAASEKGAALRIGVNSGSLPADLANSVSAGKLSRSKALCEAALREVHVCESFGFTNLVVSMKASSVQETIEANRAFALQSDIPLHVGVTEAGPLITGVVKSTLAFSALLSDGIGSTIRVSLSSSPENEVIAAREILHECGKRSGGVTLVSCPRCGREGFDVHGFMERWQNTLLSLKKNVTIAVMGCVVNGPGEASHADLGIAGGGQKVILFKHGKIMQTIDAKDADTEFRNALESL